MRVLFLGIIIIFTACSNLHVEGNFKATEKNAKNEFVIKSNLSDNVFISSKISQPYLTNQYPIPDYTETSLEWFFW